MSACITLHRYIQDAKSGPWSQMKRSCVLIHNTIMTEKKLGKKKKKNLTSALGFSHLEIQRHLDVKLDFEFTYRRGYRAQRKCWPEAAEVGCRGHPWRSPKGCRQQHRLWGSAAHGAVVTQRRTSVGCPPPPHPQLVTDLTTAARDFSGNQGSDFSPPWKTYSS